MRGLGGGPPIALGALPTPEMREKANPEPNAPTRLQKMVEDGG